MWPYIGEYAKDLLKNSVEPAVQNSLPNSLKPFKFERIDLGDIVRFFFIYVIIAAPYFLPILWSMPDEVCIDVPRQTIN